MNESYTQYYGSSRHDGYIAAETNCKGNIEWEYKIPPDDQDLIEARLILNEGKNIFIDATSEIICLDENGKMLWKREKWYGSPVVIKNKMVYYTSAERADRMEAVDFQNNIKVSDFVIYEIIPRSFLTLFEPASNELIAQVQYTGLQEVAVDKFVIYKSATNSLGYVWSKIFNEEICPLIPLVNFEKKFLLTADNSSVYLFDINSTSRELEPKVKFPLPENSGNIFVSSSAGGLIYFGYSKEDKTILNVFDEAGKESYSVEYNEEYKFINKVIAPPIITGKAIFLLTSNALINIKNKAVSWEIKSGGTPFSFATGLKDNSILVTKDNMLYHYSENGKELFSKKTDNKITAPPIVDSEGTVYVCTADKLFCIK